MSRAAKHHKKVAKHQREARHTKRAHRVRTTSEQKKPATREEQFGVAETQQKNLRRPVGSQSDEPPVAYAEPMVNTVEVMEIEVVKEPEGFLEADEAEPLLVPAKSLLEDEE